MNSKDQDAAQLGRHWVKSPYSKNKTEKIESNKYVSVAVN